MESHQTHKGEWENMAIVFSHLELDVCCHSVTRPALADTRSSQLPPRQSSLPL